MPGCACFIVSASLPLFHWYNIIDAEGMNNRTASTTTSHLTRPSQREAARLPNADAAPKNHRVASSKRARSFPYHHTSAHLAQRGGGGVHPPPRARRAHRERGRGEGNLIGCRRERVPPTPRPRHIHEAGKPPRSPRAGRGLFSPIDHCPSRRASDEAVVERGARGGGRRRRQRERGGAADVRPAVGGGAAGGGADAGAGARRALHPRGAARLRLPPMALRLLTHPPRLRISGSH